MTFVFLRDASWWNRPDTRSVKVYHHNRGDDALPSAACTGYPLDEQSFAIADEVPLSLRCRRHGCRQLWDAQR